MCLIFFHFSYLGSKYQIYVRILLMVKFVLPGFFKGLICKRKRAKFSDYTVPQKKGIEIAVAEKVKEETAAPPLGVSAVKYQTEGTTDHVDQSDDGANGYSQEHANGSICTSKEPARLRLHTICSAARWKEPSYNFEEQGSSHGKL
ncbi:hypothetical protein ABZP36_036076 [Zizania latifolia]